MTTPSDNHPWAKYYAERGVDRPLMAELRRPVVPAPVKAEAATSTAQLSPELLAALAAVTTRPPVTTAPFITAGDKQRLQRENKREQRLRWLKLTALACAALVVVHLAVTQGFNRAPAVALVSAHAASIPAELLPLYSSVRQPLQIDRIVVSEPERISSDRMRYTAQVTLRLRKPLYAPAVTNGTAAYRELQAAVQSAHEQESRYNLFNGADAPEMPELPLLIRTMQRAGDSVVVKVPFYARRFGWSWKMEAPQLGLRSANRTFVGDSIEHYSNGPHLIFGTPEALVEMRSRTRQARDYVFAVTSEVQRQADVPAVDASLPDIAFAEAVADAGVEHLPAVDPDAPAVAEPAFDPHAPAVALPTESTEPNGPKLSQSAARTNR